MKYVDFKLILFREIVAEGLEGITLESLWEHVKVRNNKIIKDIESSKEFYWNIISKFEFINFYQLPAPRQLNFKAQNLKEQFNMSNNCFSNMNEPYEYEFSCVLNEDDNIFGSCESYLSRVCVDDEIKNQNLTYEFVKCKYGDTLVMVANQKCRMSYLSRYDYSLSKAQYAHLEYIGRHRNNGLIMSGNTTSQFFSKDAKTTWLLNKVLKEKNLIRIQRINVMNSSGVINDCQLIHISRCYKPYFNIFEQKVDKLYKYLSLIPCKAVSTTVCLQVLQMNDTFLNRAEQNEWIEIITTTYRKLNKTCHLPLLLSDTELLSLYIRECNLPANELYSFDLLDKVSSFVIITKPLDELVLKLDDRMKELSLIYLNIKDTDVVPKVKYQTSLTKNQLNFDDPSDIQVLSTLANQPMSMNDIRGLFGNISINRLLKNLLETKKIYVSYMTKDKNSVAYYSVCEMNQPDQNRLPCLPSTRNINCDDVPSSNLSTINNSSLVRNPRRQERYQYLVDLVKTRGVIPGHVAAQRLIKDWEISKNLVGIMDKKSFCRILDDAIANKDIETVHVELGDNKSEMWLVLPGTTEQSEQFKAEFRLKQEMIESKSKLINIVMDNATGDKKKKKKKKKKRRTDVEDEPRIIVDFLSQIKISEYDGNRLSDFVFPELPLMIKLKLLHEFIWYISIGIYKEPGFCTESAGDNNDVYSNEPNWKRYVTPLSPDIDSESLNFAMNDLLTRIPLSLFCLIITPKECNQALIDYLSDEKLRLKTVGNITKSNPALISFLLNQCDKFCRRKLMDFLENLVNMGAISRQDFRATYREQGLFTINREVFLTDTSNYSLPISDQEVWRDMSRNQWILATKYDLANYWESVYSVCTCTRTKMGLRPPGIPILSREYSESMRNSEYISSHVTRNGHIAPEHVEQIKQFGAWLPMDSLKWKNISAGGYYRSILSWNILSWCHNRFDKSCRQLPDSVARGLLMFRTTIFMDLDRDKTTVKYINNFNENLSYLLNEINIILVGVKLLQYDKEMDFFWSKMRKCKWFRTMFPMTCCMNLETLNGYISVLTSDHATERQYIIDLVADNEPIQNFLKNKRTKSFRKDNWLQEGAIIRLLLIQLSKIHQFIPQWDSLPQNGTSIGELVDEINPSNIRLRMRFEETKKQTIPGEPSKRAVHPDKVDTVESILQLSLMKYLTGCLHPYQEFNSIDLGTRNTIFKQYSLQMTINALNTFGNFYALEPLKAKNIMRKSIADGCFDVRLRKLGDRFVIQTRCSTHHDLTISQYLTWCDPPHFDGNKATFNCSFSNLEMKDLMFSFSFLYLTALQNKPNNIIDVNLKAANFAFNDKKYKTKTVCHSSVYSINLKDLKLTDADWKKMTNDSSLVISIGKGTYKALYNTAPQTHIWSYLSRSILLPKVEAGESTNKKQKPMPGSSQLENMLAFIEEGEFGGKNYSELKSTYLNTDQLNDLLQKLINSDEIFVVGINTFHFVSKNFIRPWLVKLPLSGDGVSSQSLRSNRKRTMSTSSTDNCTYFIPEFYRDESAQFKCVTFKEIINKIYFMAHKTCGTTLAELMADLSSFLGINVVRQLINVLVEYNVLELVQLKSLSKVGLFRPRVAYTVIDTNPFDNGADTTFHVNPLSHLNMANLIRDMSRYFCVNFSESVLDDSNEMMEESKVMYES